MDFWNFRLDFWISRWISGFHSGFLDFSLDFWISGFQFGFLPTVYEISFVTDPSLTTVLRQLHDHPSITKAVGRLFHSIAISSQLNAAPYLRHKPWQLLVHVLREETVPAVLNSRFHVCTSHAPGREFLSDAPFFGLSLWTEFKLANCACASGWSSTLEP